MFYFSVDRVALRRAARKQERRKPIVKEEGRSASEEQDTHTGYLNLGFSVMRHFSAICFFVLFIVCVRQR